MTTSVTYTLSISGIGDNISQAVPILAEGINSLSVSIPDESTDKEVTYTPDVSAVQVFYMQADQDLTIKTNSSSVPQETISLSANEPVLYAPGLIGSASPFADDVTGLFVSNDSGAAATLIIKDAKDVTPA